MIENDFCQCQKAHVHVSIGMCLNEFILIHVMESWPFFENEHLDVICHWMENAHLAFLDHVMETEHLTFLDLAMENKHLAFLANELFAFLEHVM